MNKEYRKLKNLMQDIIASGYDLDDLTAAYKALSTNKRKIEESRENALKAMTDYLLVLRPEANSKDIEKIVETLRKELEYYEIIAEAI